MTPESGVYVPFFLLATGLGAVVLAVGWSFFGGRLP